MKNLVIKVVLSLAIAGCLATSAEAASILWTLNGVTLDDGGTATGTFVFDADAGTPCTSGSSPCGAFSNVNIVTTDGTSLTGTTYTLVCGTDVATCNGVSPDSTEVLFLASSGADLTGNAAIAFFFTAAGPLPPAGLSDAGGTIDISNGAVGVVNEAPCSDATCSAPGSPSRASVSGTVTGVPFTATPEPATCALLLTGMAGLAVLRRRRGV